MISPINPQKPVLSAGGSQIIINKNGITVITPAKFEVKAGQHKFESGAQVSSTIPELPTWTPHEEFFIIHDQEGKPIPNQHYIMTDEDGSKIEGYTDENGKTEKFKSMQPKQVKIQLLERKIQTEYHHFVEEFYGKK